MRNLTATQNVLFLVVLFVFLSQTACTSMNSVEQVSVDENNCVFYEDTAHYVCYEQNSEVDKSELVVINNEQPSEDIETEVEREEEIKPTVLANNTQAAKTCNLRAEPGLNGKRVGLVKKGTPLQIQSVNGTSWYSVDYQGQKAFISSICF